MYAWNWQAMHRFLTLSFSVNRITGLQAHEPASNRQDETKEKKLLENKKWPMIPFPDTKMVPFQVSPIS